MSWSALWALAVVLVACAVTLPAAALPGVFVGKGKAKRVSNATQVVLMKHGPQTVVTIWPDYEGPLDKFALVLPVPQDVSLTDVTALKRDAVDHLDEISAPRFHEFWEMDPCEDGEAQQEWERDLRVKSGPGFLAEGMPDMSGGHKLAKELQMDFEPQFKEGEYTFRLIGKGTSVKSFLEGKGLFVSPDVAKSLSRYQDEGMSMLVAEVRTSKVELTGARRALLSPIRFVTSSKYVVPSTLGLHNRSGHQELVLYVMHPEKRFQVANYDNVFPPTNATVDVSVKERMGDFYAGLHDALLQKNPKAFLVEYAWPTIKECGEPCPNAPMMIHELLTLGADAFERDVPADRKNPKPPEMTPEEKERFDAADAETKARLKEQRQEVMRRRAVLDRNRYVITRLHHRYDDKGLPEDLELEEAPHVEGGLGAPKGPSGSISTEVSNGAESHLQIRYQHLYPSKKVVHCDNPQRYRWGKAPRSYRGLRKTWTARDLAYRKRDRFPLAEVVVSPMPALGIAGKPVAGDEAKPDEGSQPKADSGGCAVSRAPLGSSAAVAWLLLAGLVLAARRTGTSAGSRQHSTSRF